MTRSSSRRFRGLRWLAWLVVVVTVGSCASGPIPRADWGAVTPDARLRVTTVDGKRYDVRSPVMWEDALEGVMAGGYTLVRIPLGLIAEVREDRRGPFHVFTAVAVLGAAIGIIQALAKGDVHPPT